MEARSVEVLLARARRRAAGGDTAGAGADFDRAVRYDPSSPRVRLARAEWLISAGNLVAARTDVDRAVELGAGTDTLAVRGRLTLHLDGDPEAAERDLTGAIDAGDCRPSSYVARGWARYVRGDHSGALADAVRAASRDPLDGEVRFLVAVSRIWLGDRGGIRDLDRAEALYVAAGEYRGRQGVWRVREEIRQGRTPLPVPPAPWLFSGPPCHEPAVLRGLVTRCGESTDSPSGRGDTPGGDGLRDHGGAGARGVTRVRDGRLTLIVAVAIARYLTTVVVFVLLTLLPGVSAGSPYLVTVLVASLSYRVLRAGASSLLVSLLMLVPVSAVPWAQAGSMPLVALVRWVGAAALAALAFAVAGWVTRWLGLDFRVGGLATVLTAGLLFGLGTFVAFSVLRRDS